jgi:hypothetical protein
VPRELRDSKKSFKAPRAAWKEKTGMDIRRLDTAPEQLNRPMTHQGKPKDGPAASPSDRVTLGNTPEPPARKKWTFLHYGAGDNNLSSYIYHDVDEMEAVGSDANTNIVSQLDGSRGNCKRYYLQKDEKPGTITSPVLEDMGPKVNMADPKTLTDFIVWGVSKYPADHVALIIGDHGGGTDGAISDDRDGGWGMMKPPDIEKAVKDAQALTNKKIDLLGFDCCLMANTEVAYQLRDTADFLIASEENEGGDGWPYNKVLSGKVLRDLQEALRNKIEISPRDFAVAIIKDAGEVQGDLPTLSALDMAKMTQVAKGLDAFSKAILETAVPMSTLRSLASSSQSFGSFKDLYDFAQRVVDAPSVKDEELKESAKRLLENLKTAIIAEQHSKDYPGAHGLHIEVSSYSGPSEEYKALALSADTSWDEARARIAKG